MRTPASTASRGLPPADSTFQAPWLAATPKSQVGTTRGLPTTGAGAPRAHPPAARTAEPSMEAWMKRRRSVIYAFPFVSKKNKSPAHYGAGLVSSDLASRSDRLDVGRLLALRTLGHLKLDLLVLLKGLEAIAADRGKVNEKILPAGVGRNETKALRIVEPFNRTSRHCHC